MKSRWTGEAMHIKVQQRDNWKTGWNRTGCEIDKMNELASEKIYGIVVCLKRCKLFRDRGEILVSLFSITTVNKGKPMVLYFLSVKKKAIILKVDLMAKSVKANGMDILSSG